ncbi:hypothetical protein ABZP36_000600 [Zizania latifolia]
MLLLLSVSGLFIFPFVLPFHGSCAAPAPRQSANGSNELTGKLLSRPLSLQIAAQHCSFERNCFAYLMTLILTSHGVRLLHRLAPPSHEATLVAACRTSMHPSSADAYRLHRWHHPPMDRPSLFSLKPAVPKDARPAKVQELYAYDCVKGKVMQHHSSLHVSDHKSADGHAHGHGYSSHMSHNPNGNPNDGSSGTPAVDPHAVAARGGHHHRGAASRTSAGYSRLQATCTFLGAAFLLVLS